MKAKKKLKKLGFGNKKKGVCKDCGKEGHWKGDPVCPEVIAGRTPEFKPKAKAKKKSGGGQGQGAPKKDRKGFRNKGKKGSKGAGAYELGVDPSTEEDD